MSAKLDIIRAGNDAAAEINLWDQWKQELADHEPLRSQRSVVLELTLVKIDDEMTRLQAIKTECLAILQERWDRDAAIHDESGDVL